MHEEIRAALRRGGSLTQEIIWEFRNRFSTWARVPFDPRSDEQGSDQIEYLPPLELQTGTGGGIFLIQKDKKYALERMKPDMLEAVIDRLPDLLQACHQAEMGRLQQLQRINLKLEAFLIVMRREA